MALDAYNRELLNILSKKRAPRDGYTRQEIESQIAAISALLKGPLPNVERLDLIEARRQLRVDLEAHP